MLTGSGRVVISDTRLAGCEDTLLAVVFVYVCFCSVELATFVSFAVLNVTALRDFFWLFECHSEAVRFVSD